MVSDTSGVCVLEVNTPRPPVEEELKKFERFVSNFVHVFFYSHFNSPLIVNQLVNHFANLKINKTVND